MSGYADACVIEPVKENVQPLRAGRDPHKLIKAIQEQETPNDKDIQLSHAAGCSAHEQAIMNYQGSSPLTPWLSYIAWTIDAHTTLSGGSHLTPLLEKCTRTFINDKTMYNDTGYVKVWLMYADRCPDPASVYQFMQARGIGEISAARYVAISAWHEARADYAQAEAVIQLGIDKAAKPANTLTSAMRSLASRNSHRISQQMAVMTAELDPLDPLVSSAMHDDAPRKALTQIVDQENGEFAGVSFATVTRPAQQTHRSATVAPSTARIGNASFQIFDDSRPAEPSTQQTPESGWTTLSSIKAADKENAATITTWNVPLVSKSEIRMPVHSDIPVFTDVSCIAPVAPAIDADRLAHAAEVRKRLAAPSKPSTDAKLAQDPLRHLVKKAPAPVTSAPAAQVITPSAPAPRNMPQPQINSIHSVPAPVSVQPPRVQLSSRPTSSVPLPSRPLSNPVAPASIAVPSRSLLSTRPGLSTRPPITSTLPSTTVRPRPMGR